MDLRSPFQTLPMLIVYKVVEYLEGCPRKLHGSSTDDYSKKGDALAPLLLVSERWSTAALASICSVCTLSFSHSREAIEVRFPGWPSSVPHSQYSKTHLAKKVIASVNVWQELCDGKLCEVITLPQYENLSFPSARFFELRLSKTAKKDGVVSNSMSSSVLAPELSQEQVASAVRCLLRLVPAVVDVDMTACSIGDTEPNFVQLYEWLVTELCRGCAKSLRIWSWTRDTELSLSLSNISGLTSITQGNNVSNSTFTTLAYLNAKTLKSLDIVLLEDDWYNLVYGGTEDDMVYADLASLKLRVDEGVPYDITWQASEPVESFPALSTLDVRGGYPFGDDLLFRGNGETLQNLRLPFSALCRNALGRFDVLKRSGVTRMNSIHIGKIYEADEGFLTANPDVPIEKQVHRILEMTSSLVLLNDTKARHLLNSICSAPNTATLEYLEFDTLNFYANGVFNMIAALPSLFSLKCRVSCCGPAVEKAPASERPSTLYAERYPLSHNFRALKTTYVAKASAREMAHVAMLLMVVCPSLKTVDVIPSLRNEFSREIAWSMINTTYKPYADRLNTLIHLE